ncbi:hypothetical protein CDAR_111191 [Caerostris darwini]|uniref:Uncharacterized protein n=1 Tax=Caerostris darwini TaxID=1538125 RepID=A0AAV4SUD6_9ARAC|nr:hypothetical protein CDAR_111191 [Caerostris darwini]
MELFSQFVTNIFTVKEAYPKAPYYLLLNTQICCSHIQRDRKQEQALIPVLSDLESVPIQLPTTFISFKLASVTNAVPPGADLISLSGSAWSRISLPLNYLHISEINPQERTVSTTRLYETGQDIGLPQQVLRRAFPTKGSRGI